MYFAQDIAGPTFRRLFLRRSTFKQASGLQHFRALGYEKDETSVMEKTSGTTRAIDYSSCHSKNVE